MAEQSEKLLRTLLGQGFEAYWVGGCVRDELIGRPVHDMDMTTSALPEEMIGLFQHTIPTGIQHGTITVMLQGHAFEVTTYRVESTYENHRRPDEVTFVKEITEDLKRRDFTMNAIARAVDGTYIDPFGGQQDTAKKIIRCVGNPLERFNEDALRMVRCVRFASVFGYSIAKDTWKGLLSQRANLEYIALERIRVELEKVISGNNPLRGLELLSRSQLLDFAKIPVLSTRFDRDIVMGINKVSLEPICLRWAVLLYAGRFTSEEAGQQLRKWTFSNQDKDEICSILRLDEQVKKRIQIQDIGIAQEERRLSWIRLVLDSGRSTALNWLKLQRTLPEHRQSFPIEWLDLFSTWEQQMNIYQLKDLGITGREVMKVNNIPAGSWLGDLLQHLLLSVAAGIVDNDKNGLIEEIKRVNMNHG
ncbi:hypothetical protein PGLA_06505 [Paenibacillus glacialis]|uniref:CCA tRNA nucleotidyltransferase n=2 Tax=Paenibacillus glacialis TaxID=494026 RepID=A0A168MEN8_9BACL|nr:hypothetical protein PGLA_06505 [Paenibacillus glacialis]